jgi:hypothetical protein
VDVEYDDTFNVLLERNGKFRFKDCDYAFRREVMTLDAAKFLYPDVKGKITSTKSVKVYDFETMGEKVLPNMVVVWRFFHKPTRFFPKGIEIRFTRDAICKKPEPQAPA